MQITRTIHNELPYALELTLFIQAATNPEKLYGTVNVMVPSGAAIETAYGNLGNSFLCGLLIARSSADFQSELFCRVEHAGDSIDKWLNGGDSLAITANRLKMMFQNMPDTWLSHTLKTT